jgi:hypothetical protein
MATWYLVVVDVDSVEAEEQLRSRIELRPTFMVGTGRGVHLYYLTDRPMASANRLFRDAGIFNVDVKGVNGYVLGPGSLHYSGSLYTALTSISDLRICSPQLESYLVPFGATKQRVVTDVDDNVIPFRPRPLKDLPAEVLEILNQSPEVGYRSEVAWKAALALLDLTDDEKSIAGTMMAHNIGESIRTWRRCMQRSSGPSPRGCQERSIGLSASPNRSD